MEDTAKYLIHADLVADSVVDRSDVVGAVYGQTEGLLGDELELRDLQESSKLGRIDVSVESEGGQSFGHITVASNLDKVETAILAAALEAIERVGPCRATVDVARIEDVRAAKRREVVDRAKELLATAFDDGAFDGEDLVDEVRESVRVDDITEYEGLPAGPRVPDSDAVVVVEGRADVQRLLRYGIKNAIAVEGTDVPDAVTALTEDRTTTAFFDGDRGGDLILRELAQVGDVDYVAHPPEGSSVEDLDRAEVDAALRQKVPFDPGAVSEGEAKSEAASEAEAEDEAETERTAGAEPEAREAAATPDAADPETANAATDGSTRPAPAPDSTESTDRATTESPTAHPKGSEPAPKTVADHVEDLRGSGRVRLLDGDLEVVEERPADDAFDALADADDVPSAVVLDGTVTQRLLDLAAQRGVAKLVGTEEGQFVKQPASVRVLTADRF
ncbi:DNA primase DnaG [Halospeciosus flavus]|uniref:DNA primase DnaG n=1 Tax=Halospeciosus flavus TaxID=3032283 RepID=A0ABD5Z934_9EURY|nr:DNA primase DnaG [Halospeciosus flavus]